MLEAFQFSYQNKKIEVRACLLIVLEIVLYILIQKYRESVFDNHKIFSILKNEKHRKI